jgi:hypothetical protein
MVACYERSQARGRMNRTASAYIVAKGLELSMHQIHSVLESFSNANRTISSERALLFAR